jgi:glucose-1-phosphate thymidylyltransferase
MTLRAIVLAGGFGKRLGPLAKEVPKPLLPLRGKPAIDHILVKLLEAGVEEVVVSTNLKFEIQFETWLRKAKLRNVRIEVEPSKTEEEKFGAIGGIARMLKQLHKDDYFVVAGDNVFTDSLHEMAAFFREIKKSVVAGYYAANLTQLKLGSSVTTDSKGRIMLFEEKPVNPDLSKPVGACIYTLPHSALLRTREYVDEGMNADEPGRFISWLCEREDVYMYVLKGHLWDIGSVAEYERAKHEFT